MSANAFDVAVATLLQKARKLDPALADTLTLIANELGRIGNIVDPKPTVQSKSTTSNPLPPPDVLVFSYVLSTENIALLWQAPSFQSLLYEVREGATWSTATRLFITGNLDAILDPSAVGDTTYLIKAISSAGIYSINATSVVVTVPAIGALRITPGQINNTVLLAWSVPTSTFRIASYNVYKDDVLQFNLTGTFATITEVIGGTYKYSVEPIDIAGNIGTRIDATLDVSSPTDYEFQDSLTSGFSGTIVNGIVEDADKLLVCVDIAETFEDHFINNGWANPQDQVNAGYSLFIEPSLTTASYEEIFDFSTILQNVIVNLSYSNNLIIGSMAVALDIKVSDDNITYSTAYTTASFFTTSVRYVKAKLTFTGGSDMSLMELYNFIISLIVKREVDGSDASVFAADVGGTVINFIKPFKSVESITVSSKATVQQQIVYDFAGGINPTSFKVLLYDAAGARIDGTVSWKARGVI
jgi:hypothetical protein